MASGNVLPLHLFRHLYPDCIDKTGHPTGPNVSNTRLTAYNGTWIPLFGSLHGPITWEPGSPGAQPCHVNSSWYVADTPAPAILGFPSCERLKSSRSHPRHFLAAWFHSSTTSTQENRSNQVYRGPHQKFPDRFQGIGQFPFKYTIRLCDDAQPVIHALEICPISIHPRVKAELDKMVKLGVITPVDEPPGWVSSVAYAWKASGELCLCLDPHDLNNAVSRGPSAAHPQWMN